MERERFDLRRAINAVSDVIQNRPLPLREFDQIYMKAGDMVMQSELMAHRFHDKEVIFIGDGDAISLCMAYLKARGVLRYGPKRIHLVDFDERIVNAVNRFADKEGISEVFQAELYNCIDALPAHLIGKFDAFYTNPPWGASNEGESVKVFSDRGIEALRDQGIGVIVIADDPTEAWPQQVLKATQDHASKRGFFVQEMQSQVHLYHLDDAPDLKSCNLVVKAAPGREACTSSQPLDLGRIENFYGRNNHLKVRYVKEKSRVDYGKAPTETYKIQYLEDSQ